MFKFFLSCRSVSLQRLTLFLFLTLGFLPAQAAESVNSPADINDPGSAMYTIDDIYQRLVDGTPGRVRNDEFMLPNRLPGQRTSTDLNQIMSVAPAIDAADAATPEDVLAGKRFWGLKQGQWGYHVGTWEAPGFRAVRVKVEGLSGNSPVVLDLNGGDELLTVSRDTVTAFSTQLEPGAHYDVTVAKLPLGRDCHVFEGEGIIGAQDIELDVFCDFQPEFTLSGTVENLDGVVELKNERETLTLHSDGAFNFQKLHAEGYTYNVTVSQQPEHQICSIENFNGVFTGADISDIKVVCSHSADHQLRATVDGLLSGKTLTLVNNGDTKNQSVQVTGNGEVTFPEKFAREFGYTVTVLNQPEGLICNVTNGQGVFGQGDIDNLRVDCEADARYFLRVTVNNVVGDLAFQNSDGETLVASLDGLYSFKNLNASGFSYQVSVENNPLGQHCNVEDGAGIFTAADVDNVVINCSNDAIFRLGGEMEGLDAGASLVLLLNNGNEHLTIVKNGPFSFNAPHAIGFQYLVEIQTPHVAQTCGIANGAGEFTNSDITNVEVACLPTPPLQLKPVIEGLGASKSVVLSNGGKDLHVDTNGEAIFPDFYMPGINYKVTVTTQPAGQECTVTNGSGTFADADVTSVKVTCADLPPAGFQIIPLISGLDDANPEQGLVLQNNGGDDLSVTMNGVATFNTPLQTGDAYKVSIKTKPAGMDCGLVNEEGTVKDDNIETVIVDCFPPGTVGVRAEVCHGGLCGLIPGNDPVVTCPATKPFAANIVENDASGTKTFIKRCETEHFCNAKWWHESSDQDTCVKFDPTKTYHYPFVCTYCCTTDGCNSQIYPEKSTLFKGST